MENLYSRSIVEYCERIGNSFFSQPINFFSNAAFLISAYFIFKLFKNIKEKRFEYWILFCLILLIGLGSALWHSFKTPFTLALDAVPIYLFLLVFLYLLLKNLIRNTKRSLIGISSFVILQLAVSIYLPEVLNGSIRHVVNASVFLLLNLWIYKESKKLNFDFIFAFLVYVLGITFRTIDNTVCSLFPSGTHFLWHMFTALTTYLAVRGLMRVESDKRGV